MGDFFSIKIPHMITWCENSLCHFNRANTNCVKHFYCYIYIYIYIYWFQRFLNVWKVPLHLWQEFTVRDHYWWMSVLFFFLLQGKKVCASFPLALWDNKKKSGEDQRARPSFFGLYIKNKLQEGEATVVWFCLEKLKEELYSFNSFLAVQLEATGAQIGLCSSASTTFCSACVLHSYFPGSLGTSDLGDLSKLPSIMQRPV